VKSAFALVVRAPRVPERAAEDLGRRGPPLSSRPQGDARSLDSPNPLNRHSYCN
jgi:hypothetical protein